MATRFRRTFKIAPGVRVNFGKRGASLSAGVRGASMTFGRKGLYGNIGVPGTGLSVRNKISSGYGGSSINPRDDLGPGDVAVQFALRPDGSVEITDRDGNPLPPRMERRAKREGAERLEAWLEASCAEWNQGIQEILEVHITTPAPDPPATFDTRDYDVPPPDAPVLEKAGFLEKIFTSRRERREARNRHRSDEHRQTVEAWESAKATHDAGEALRRTHFVAAQSGDVGAIADVLEDRLATLEWPRETSASLEIHDDRCVWLDVDLPEIEDLPSEQAAVAKRGLKINVKHKSDTQRRKEYMTHVHAIAFRLAGEVFNLLPAVPRVVISGYSQRPDPATAQIRDDYLYSVAIDASRWREINFGALASLDLVECFAQFELRRKMTQTGIFKPIEPFAPIT